MTTIREKIEYIDFFRGGGVFLIILQHCGIPKIGNYILAFHMPLFFVLTGYLFNNNNTGNVPFKKYIIKRFNRLMIPYICFEILNLLLSYGVTIISNNHIDIIQAIKSIVLCINNSAYSGISLRLWFLPCMFVSSIMFYLINFIIYRVNGMANRWMYGMVSVLFILCSYYEKKVLNERIPFTLDISLMATAFIALGYSFKDYLDNFIKFEKFKLILLLLTSMLICVITVELNYSPFFMYINEYGNYVLAIIGALSGMVCFFAFLSLVLMKENYLHLGKKLLNFFSDNSLLIFPVHLEIIWFIGIILNKINFISNSLNWIIKIFVVLVLLIPFSYIIKNYFSFMIGRKREC